MASSGLFCSTCGQVNDVDAEFCSKCGARQKPAGQTPGQTSEFPPSSQAVPPPAVVASTTGWQSTPSYQATAAAPGYAQSDLQSTPRFSAYGGFWMRVLAALIDGAVTAVVLVPVMVVLIVALGLASAGSREPNPAAILGFMAIWFPIGIGLPWIYAAAMESSKYEATLGKMALGMKVTDLQGNRISFGRATGRHFGKIVSGMILYIGFIMAGFTERKQGLHDMLAGTLVIRK